MEENLRNFQHLAESMAYSLICKFFNLHLFISVDQQTGQQDLALELQSLKRKTYLACTFRFISTYEPQSWWLQSPLMINMC